jgi:hypothetical protein
LTIFTARLASDMDTSKQGFILSLAVVLGWSSECRGDGEAPPEVPHHRVGPEVTAANAAPEPQTVVVPVRTEAAVEMLVEMLGDCREIRTGDGDLLCSITEQNRTVVANLLGGNRVSLLNEISAWKDRHGEDEERCMSEVYAGSMAVPWFDLDRVEEGAAFTVSSRNMADWLIKPRIVISRPTFLPFQTMLGLMCVCNSDNASVRQWPGFVAGLAAHMEALGPGMALNLPDDVVSWLPPSFNAALDLFEYLENEPPTSRLQVRELQGNKVLQLMFGPYLPNGEPKGIVLHPRQEVLSYLRDNGLGGIFAPELEERIRLIISTLLVAEGREQPEDIDNIPNAQMKEFMKYIVSIPYELKRPNFDRFVEELRAAGRVGQ